MSSKYVDISAVIQVIGNVFNNPSLLELQDKYIITDNDFSNEFHKVVFGSMFKLHELGVTEFTLENINDFLATRPKYEAVYKSNKGDEWILKASEAAVSTAFDYYYQRLKKFSLLRAFDNYGIDVSDIYDVDNILDIKKKQLQEDLLDNSSLEQIANKVDLKIEEIRATYVNDDCGEAKQAGEGILALINRFKEFPEAGVAMYGPLINTVTRGARLRKFYLRSAPTGVGKCIPDYTIIPTPIGDRKVSDIKVGDELFDGFGNPTKVLAVYPQGEKEVWEVEFKDGRKAECCEEHLWSYCTVGQKKVSKENRKFYTNTLKEISKKELYRKSDGYQILVPMQQAVHFSKKDFSIDPYILGLALGDGSFRYDSKNKAFMFSSADEELVNSFETIMGWSSKKYSNHSFYSWYFEDLNNLSHKNVWVEEFLKDYPKLWNVKSEDKFIPQEYFMGSIEQRLDLLNGLLDTDGSIDKEKGRISFYTVSNQLKEDVIKLSLSLGFKATYLIDDHKDTLPVFKIEITGKPEDKVKLFKLSRKKEIILNWFNNGKRKENNLFNPIVKITKTNKKTPMTCFYVDNDEHLFLMNDYIVTHNTRTMIADICYIACEKIYDEQFGWIGSGPAQPCLYITTEQDLEEIQTMMLAFISNVNEDHIIYNEYEDGEEERVRMAAEMIAAAPLYIEELPDFSLQDVEDKIKKNIREHEIKYCFHDYIHTSLKILEEITRRSGGVRLREDNVLFMLSTRLKDICNKYGVFIMSATQLSGDYVDSKTPDQNLLRGAKAIADKIDFGSILLPVKDEDLVSLEPVLAANVYEKPNLKLSIYKNRRGKYKGIYLWCRANLGTCRVKPMFATGYDYGLIEMDDIKITLKEPSAFEDDEE